eukprot:CAMPEP_0195133304 /NCGR_PEP_ID=MMETSP0448-20130528/148544_1 /TAXON_ID=66468 /ORGANISM="Heterocapsa triquestra, Strain CCMP 448" /LENGTH=50 /DNA_ID=CAMNT_0040171353 /DNA_START=46 /DNA_END=195 /DNA_ORIENTATION=+
MATRRLFSALARPAGATRLGLRFAATEGGAERKQRIVIAVGGNALIRRGE